MQQTSGFQDFQKDPALRQIFQNHFQSFPRSAALKAGTRLADFRLCQCGIAGMENSLFRSGQQSSPGIDGVGSRRGRNDKHADILHAQKGRRPLAVLLSRRLEKQLIDLHDSPCPQIGNRSARRFIIRSIHDKSSGCRRCRQNQHRTCSAAAENQQFRRQPLRQHQ